MQIDFVGRSNITETAHPFGRLVILSSVLSKKGLLHKGKLRIKSD